MVGLCRYHRGTRNRSNASNRHTSDAPDNASMEPLPRYVEAAYFNPLSAHVQESHRSEAALCVHRAIDSIEGILPAQGHRMGTAPVCVDESRRNTTLRGKECQPAQSPEPARSVEEHL